MSKTQVPTAVPNPLIDMNDFMTRSKAYEKRAADLIPSNKASLFAALAAAGISHVCIAFNGYGDSGQIEDVTAKAGEAEADLPAVDVEIASAEFGSETITRVSQPLADAIESFCFDLLESHHGGWENNEGAYGDFTFDIAADSIVFDFNYRIETSENHSYEY